LLSGRFPGVEIDVLAIWVVSWDRNGGLCYLGGSLGLKERFCYLGGSLGVEIEVSAFWVVHWVEIVVFSISKD